MTCGSYNEMWVGQLGKKARRHRGIFVPIMARLASFENSYVTFRERSISDSSCVGGQVKLPWSNSSHNVIISLFEAPNFLVVLNTSADIGQAIYMLIIISGTRENGSASLHY